MPRPLSAAAPPLEASSRSDFQRALDRLADDPAAREELRPLLDYAVALNAVLAQSLRVFFEDGCRADTSARAALALALHAADAGKFSFPDCDACALPERWECPPRQRWLESLRYRAMLGDRIEVRGS